ncbi:hypothetical protein T06_10883 [Trichinella sp. T6]|nr:hypothetical protein T06_10883 [Trichinella sp. T6]
MRKFFEKSESEDDDNLKKFLEFAQRQAGSLSTPVEGEEGVPEGSMYALNKCNEILTFDGERYQVCSPGNSGQPDLPDNSKQARCRLTAMQRHLKK